MRHPSLDIFEQTMFRTSHIAVSHQRHTVTVDVDDTVYDISIAIHPCQHHVADINYTPWAMQDD